MIEAEFLNNLIIETNLLMYLFNSYENQFDIVE